MTEVDIIDDEFILTYNPPNDVFKEFVHLVSTTEGWAFQENDYDIWKNNYSKHWMVMIQQKGTDRYVASVSLARSDLQDGTPLFTVAFFYCLVDFRNRSFGKYLFDKIQSIYGDHNCFLFGVGTMWQWYEKRYGFKELSPYFHCSAVIQIENLKIPSGIKEVDGVTVEDLKYDSVSEYDKGICKMSRTKVINTWLMACGVHSKMAVDSNGNCVGFGAIREVSLNRLTISPLYSDCPEIAAMILKSILNSFEFSTFKSLSTIYPSTNLAIPFVLTPFCDGVFVTKEFCRSQFTQKIIKTDEKKVFGIRHCAHGYV